MILCNARLATQAPGAQVIDSAALCIEGDRITWVGPQAELGDHPGERIDLGGRLVTPGLIDCHTHVIHAGDRAREYEMRLNGASYQDIALAGGGIISTVRATRTASHEELVAQALPRLDAMIAQGVTTIEVKSGYGLTIADELKMLRVARALALHRPMRVHVSLLAAHAVPPEYAGRSGEYITEVCLPVMDAAQDEGLIDSVDGFCEGIAFSVAEIAQVFDRAQKLGLPVRLHAEQLSNLGGAALAAGYGALSADHLEYLDEAGVAAMAKAGTVAVILPGAFYTLRETQIPPIELLRQHAVRMAVATDCNPGTAPMTSLPLAMNMACTLFRMTPHEALMGVTAHAAAALGLDDCGQIAVGMRADLAIWQATHPAEISYRLGATPLYARMFGGRFDR